MSFWKSIEKVIYDVSDACHKLAEESDKWPELARKASQERLDRHREYFEAEMERLSTQDKDESIEDRERKT